MHTGHHKASVTTNKQGQPPPPSHRSIEAPPLLRIEAVLQKIQIPPFHVHFILATLVAPYHFCVGKGIVREVLFTPGAGMYPS